MNNYNLRFLLTKVNVWFKSSDRLIVRKSSANGIDFVIFIDKTLNKTAINLLFVVMAILPP